MTTTTKAIENDAAGFWKIDVILDTRLTSLVTGKIEPGTGDPIPCECCGKEINVHAHIRKIDRITKKTVDRMIVGTQCCKKAGMTNQAGMSPTNGNYWRRSWK